MYAKCKRGEDLPGSKLTEQNIVDIRAADARRRAEIARLQAEISREALARRYHVHVRTIEKALSYASWRHVHD